jgi:hypothetical protein
MFRRLAQTLDNSIANTTTGYVTSGVQETLSSFAGYEACSVNGEGINELTFSPTYLPPWADAMHPNGFGYALYAAALQAAENKLALYGDVVYL